MTTVRFYANECYWGWEKFKLRDRRSYENWIIGGNVLKVEDNLITTIPELAKALNKLETL